MAYWERRKRKRWFDIFNDINAFFEQMMREALETRNQFGSKHLTPMVYGYSVTIGPGGKPVIREFGNLKRSRLRPVVSETRDPIFEVIDEANRIIIIAELPGISREEIDLKTGDKSILIRAENPSRKYTKEISLPGRVDPSSAKATYRNGVLEVKLAKTS